MHPMLIPLLVFFAVVSIGGAIMLVRSSRRAALQARLHGRRADYDQIIESETPAPRLVSALDQVGRTIGSSKSSSNDLRERLAQAGYYSEAAPTVYVGAQFLLAISSLVILGPILYRLDVALPVRISLIFIAVALFTLIPNAIVAYQRSCRRATVLSQLPDAIDLLEICVSAGMGLNMAWNAVADEFRSASQVLTDEMALANLEMHLGASRADALRHMAHRTGVNDISSLVATLVQSERFGTSVSQALRTYADAMRNERSQRAEEAAEKLSVKLLFPMVLFIFPVLLIVILGPAGIRIAGLFTTG